MKASNGGPSAITESPLATTAAGTRNVALDAMRGLIIVLMALDHANLFIAEQHPPGEHWFRSLPEYDGAVPFLTRLVTHPVAPGFFFLMGIGMVLFARSRRRRGWSEWKIIGHFWLRGAVLIILQFTVVNLAWSTSPDGIPTLYLGVLAALGGGMMLGSLFVRLGPAILAALAAALFVGMELTHPEASEWESLFSQPLGVTLGYSGGSDFFWSNYPVLPWLELVLFGMAVGKWLVRNEKLAFDGALVAGVVFLVGFVVLRVVNDFGNVLPRPSDDWIGFFNVVKYPPAMTFTLLGMGFNLLVLGLFGRLQRRGLRLLNTLAVFGSVPLFVYVTHLYVYSAIGALEPGAASFATMYLLWLAGLAILYPACRWYGAFKRRHPDSLLRFL